MLDDDKMDQCINDAFHNFVELVQRYLRKCTHRNQTYQESRNLDVKITLRDYRNNENKNDH